MQVAKGIKGIRKFLNTDAYKNEGWHVFLNGQYAAFITGKNVYEITDFYGATLISWTGNGIFIKN